MLGTDVSWRNREREAAKDTPDMVYSHRGRTRGSVASDVLCHWTAGSPIDESTVWYGVIDFFALRGKDADVPRFEYSEIARELLEMPGKSNSALLDTKKKPLKSIISETSWSK